VLSTAHDMSREFRVLSALADTAVPVPDTVHLCADPAVLGVPFYLMRRMPGVVLRSRADCERLGAAACATLAHRLIDVLARLHRVEPDGVGLADFGRPNGYLTRQVARWNTQLAASRSRDVPGIDALHDGLAAAVPASGRSGLVHGDYRLDNVLVDPDTADITAVLDWEMATLGDPLADVGLFVVYTRRSAADDVITGGIMNAAGFPPTDALLARYADLTGADLSTLDWYVGLAYFKLAVVLEGIHFRFTQGKTVGPGYDRIGAMVPGLVAGGLAALAGKEHR
jgi:aminoglycoside phosphotransferase (APT) family kinase protein